MGIALMVLFMWKAHGPCVQPDLEMSKLDNEGVVCVSVLRTPTYQVHTVCMQHFRAACKESVRLPYYWLEYGVRCI